MVRVKIQLSVVIENRPGALTRICDAVASSNINIEGFSAYGESEHGIVRLITSDPDHAADVLADRGFLVTRGEVISVKLANRPAGLLRLARQLADHEINIDYAYGSAAQAGRMATLYLRVDNPKHAAEILGGKELPRKAKTSRETPRAAVARSRGKAATPIVRARRRQSGSGAKNR